MTDSVSVDSPGGAILAASAIAIALTVAGLVALAAIVATARHNRPIWRRGFEALRARAFTAEEGLLVGVTLLAAYAWLLAAVQAGWIVPWRDAAALRPVSLAIQTLAVPAAGLLAFRRVALMRKRRAEKAGDAMFFDSVRPGAVRVAFVAYAAVVPLVLAGALVSRVMLHALGMPVEPQGVVAFLLDENLPTWALGYFVFLAVVVAPVFEELLFRGLLLTWLARGLHPAVTVTLCSLLFAMIHFHLPSAMPLALVGAGFALAYVWTGSILTPILMHALFNGMNICLMFLLRNAIV